MIQVRLNVPVRRIRIDNGTKFVNQTLRDYYEEVGISYETSVSCSPQQNGVVERRNRTLIEAARTMLIYAQAPLFLWAEAVATACFTQNRSIIRLRHGKTPYELLHSKQPDLSFFLWQFCDSDLEVAFCQHTYLIRNLEGVDLLIGSQGNNLYTLSLQDMMASSPICLLSKASKTKSWLWHRRLSHLNFGAINHLARQGLVRGLPKLKFEKITFIQHVPWARAPRKLINPNLKTPTRKNFIFFICIFAGQCQNGVVERCNRTLIEAACTMLIYAQVPLFLWAEAVATACFTQNRSIIRLCHGKTPYELMHGKHPDLSFFHVFGALCYPTNDSENIGKLQPKADIGIFIGYAPTKKAFRIYNRRTRRIVETIHVNFDELTAMISEQSSSGPALNDMIPGTIISGLVQKSSSSTSYVPPSRNDWDLLFQPLFDELLNPPPSVDNQAAEVIAPIAEVIPQVNDDSIGSPSSTTVDQDAPSPSKFNPRLFYKMLEMIIWI
nr:integrase, catalytic region, zinc finger, CCHC-type, peptidase aspartic, catalytic [Tanacetum cinerariifolium]